MAQHKISIAIGGINLLITTSEDEDYVLQMAEDINRYIDAVQSKTHGASVTNAALLCALEYLDEYKKATRTVNHMRAQIKDYMTEAADAKRLYDDETRKGAGLEEEIKTLRGHLTRLASEGDAGGLLEKMRQEAEKNRADLKRLRKQNEDLSEQNKALAEKTDAMNNHISGQEREIARMSAVNDEMALRLRSRETFPADMPERMVQYESEIAALMSETDRLKTELDRLETLLDEQATGQVSLFTAAQQHAAEDSPAPQEDAENPAREAAQARQTPGGASLEEDPPHGEPPRESLSENEDPPRVPLDEIPPQTDSPSPSQEKSGGAEAERGEDSPGEKKVGDAAQDSGLLFENARSLKDLAGSIGQALGESARQTPPAPAGDDPALHASDTDLDVPAFMDEPVSKPVFRPAPKTDFAIDIDLSDVPHKVPSDGGTDLAQGDIFSEYAIEDDDTVIGFFSVTRDKRYEEQRQARQEKAALQTDASDDVLQKIRQISASIEDTALPLPEKSAAENTVPGKVPEKAKLPGETPSKDARARKGRLEGLQEGELPDLSWTLDL